MWQTKVDYNFCLYQIDNEDVRTELLEQKLSSLNIYINMKQQDDWRNLRIIIL